jgi:hypothetical protein
MHFHHNHVRVAVWNANPPPVMSVMRPPLPGHQGRDAAGAPRSEGIPARGAAGAGELIAGKVRRSSSTTGMQNCLVPDTHYYKHTFEG